MKKKIGLLSIFIAIMLQTNAQQNVGIGTNSPAARLHISAVTNNPLIINGTTNMFVTLAENGINRGYIGSITGNAEDVDLGTFSGNNTGKIHLTTLNTPRLTVSPAGNVGIGQPSPVYPLHFPDVLGNKISLWGTGANHYGIGIQAFQMQFYTSASYENISFGYGNSNGFTENMRIMGNGNVGIGTITPNQKLQVNGAIKISDANATPTEGTIRFNPVNKDFEGYDGSRWHSLTSNTNGTPPQSDTSESTASNDFMGQAVKFADPYIFVGVPGDDIGGNADQGSVKIFKKNIFTGTFELFQTITANDGAAGDGFGSSIDAENFAFEVTTCPSYARRSISCYVVIGAPKKDYLSKTDQGAVYFFYFDVTQNKFVQPYTAVTANDGAAGDGFGTAVCMRKPSQGKKIGFFVGAPFKTIGANPFQGKCYSFGFEISECLEPYGYYDRAIGDATFTLSNGTPFDTFGASLAFTNNFDGGTYRDAFVIGSSRRAINGQANQGAAYFYKVTLVGLEGIIYDLVNEMVATDGNANDFFGTTIAFDSRNPGVGLAVGCPGKENGGKSRQGAVYSFALNTNNGQLKQTSKLAIPAGLADDDFGSVVEFGPNGTLLVSCPGDDEGGTNAGAVFTFEAHPDIYNLSFIQKGKIMGIGPQANSRLATSISVGLFANKYVLGIPNWDLPGKTDAGKIIIGDFFR